MYPKQSQQIVPIQASSWIRNKLIFMYIYLHSVIINTHFLHISVWQEEHNYNALFKSSNAVTIFMTKGARSRGLWAPMSVEIKQNIGRVQKNKENVQVQITVCTVGKVFSNINTVVAHCAHFVLDPWISNSLQPSDVKQQHRAESNICSDIGLMPVSTKPTLKPNAD